MKKRSWHIRCRYCGLRYDYDRTVIVTHSPGTDWADASAYCPNESCGMPQESAVTDYEMRTGAIR